MAAAILERFDAGTTVGLTEGTGGVFDVIVDGITVYSKQQLGLAKLAEVDEKVICNAIQG